MDSGGNDTDTQEPPMSLPVIPDLPRSLKPQSMASGCYQPERLKQISTSRLNMRALCADMRRGNEAPLAAKLEALSDLNEFEQTYVEHSFSTRRARKSKLKDEIITEAVQAGILIPIPRRYKPTSSATLKAVPDRKDGRQGRLIYPCIRLNDNCKRPDPTPLPRVPHLISEALNNSWAWSCDIRSWFYHFEVSDEIAAKYFATRDRHGKQYGHKRAAMGWKWMPFLACSVAQYVLSRCIGDDSFGTVWIDDVICCSATRAESLRTQRRFQKECMRYQIELRDMTDVSQTLNAVGVEMDLKWKKWRLSEQWQTKMVTKWKAFDTKREVAADALWSVAGSAVWGAYAGGYSFWRFLDSVRYASRVGTAALAKGTPAAQVPLPRSVRDELRSIMCTIGRNEWRQYAPRPRMHDAIVTDASTYGLGFMIPNGADTKIVSSGIPEELRGAHINVLEVEAIVRAVHSLKPGSYWVVTDNTTAFYDIMSGLGATSMLPVLKRLQDALEQRSVTLYPIWIHTEHMAANGADSASRLGYHSSKVVRGRGSLRTCVQQAMNDTRKDLNPSKDPYSTPLPMTLSARQHDRKEWIYVLNSALGTNRVQQNTGTKVP